MAKVQANALQATWKRQIDPLPCTLMKQEMENTAEGLFNGHLSLRGLR